MNALVGFAPFIAFFAFMRLVSPAGGLWVAATVSLLLCGRMWWKGESVKILEVGSLILFAGLALYTVAVRPHWSVAGVRLVVDAGLTAIIVVSLAIRRPFTLPYARERVPEQFWATPLFMSINRAITGVWAGAFALLTAADAFAEFVPAIPLWVDVAISILALVVAFWFSRWYPTFRRRSIPGASVPVSAKIAAGRRP